MRSCISHTVPPGLLFLFKLAWRSKVRLPVLIAVVFMVTNYHFQLEINVDVRVRENNEEDLVNDDEEEEEILPT